MKKSNLQIVFSRAIIAALLMVSLLTSYLANPTAAVAAGIKNEKVLKFEISQDSTLIFKLPDNSNGDGLIALYQIGYDGQENWATSLEVIGGRITKNWGSMSENVKIVENSVEIKVDKPERFVIRAYGEGSEVLLSGQVKDGGNSNIFVKFERLETFSLFIDWQNFASINPPNNIDIVCNGKNYVASFFNKGITGNLSFFADSIPYSSIGVPVGSSRENISLTVGSQCRFSTKIDNRVESLKYLSVDNSNQPAISVELK